jgi:thiol-disulfide isomerase/thioredoxin
VLDYIVNNYVIKDGLCLDEKVGSSTQRMINQNKFLAVGTIAPNISLPGLTGEITDLSKIDGRVLLIFYSSKCPHCKTLLPEINSISDELKKKRITALAVLSIPIRRNGRNSLRSIPPILLTSPI